MITNFRDWKMFSQEHYVYEINDHLRYEILVEFHEQYTNVLNAIVTLYISGKRYNRHRLVSSILLHEALEVAHRHYETNFNKEVIHNESKRTY